MQNTSRRPVCWSIWQVTQLDASQGLEIFVRAVGFDQTFADKLYQAVSFSAAEQRVHVKYQDQVAKLAVEANQGWLASFDRARGFVLAETFPSLMVPAIQMAPRFRSGSAATVRSRCTEIRLTCRPGAADRDPYVQREIMSPLINLEPGGSCRFRTAAIDGAGNRFRKSLRSDWRFARGRIGFLPRVSPGRVRAFWEANLQLVAYDCTSQIVFTLDLGERNPCRPVLLDKHISVPPTRTVRCSLVLFDRTDKPLGVPDRVNLR